MLVIVTVGLTLFVLVVFSVYRVVEACFEKNNEQSESAAAVQSQSAAGAQEGVMSPRLERVRTTSAAGTSGEQSQLRTGERTSSVEFLTSEYCALTVSG